MKKVITHSPEETKKLAKELAGKLKKGAVLGLVGELGAGKTCFIQGLAEGLKVDKHCYVSSPTFTIMKMYKGKVPLFHFDFYRLENPAEFIDLGFDDYLKAGGITVIEWADKFMNLLPEDIVKIEFEVLSENERSIVIDRQT